MSLQIGDTAPDFQLETRNQIKCRTEIGILELPILLALVTVLTALTPNAYATAFTVAPLTDISDTGKRALAARFLDPAAGLPATPVITGSTGQVGTFLNFASYAGAAQAGDFTIASGVILSTGDATAAADTYFGGPSTNELGSGDPRLTALTGNPTFDALSFFFTFTTSQPIFELNYAFASGEYPDSVGTQSDDIMAIYLNGVNIATVPGTSTAISVNTVNGGTNSDYFLRNSDLAVTPFAYGGITQLLSASGNLNTNSPNTLEFVIADGGDGIVDSAVLLQDWQGSTDPGPAPVPEPSTWVYVGTAIGAYLLRRKLALRLKRVALIVLSSSVLLPLSAQTGGQQSLMVPIQTRIISGDGSHSSDYAIRVGNTTYPAPSDSSAYGFQVLFLDRQTLEMRSNLHIMGDVDVSPLYPIPNCGALGCLVVVQSLQNTGPLQKDDCTSPDCNVGGILGTWYGAPSDALYSVDFANPAAGYSLITTTINGLPGQGYQRLTCAAPTGCGQGIPQAGGKGAIQGSLILDNLGAYTFAYPGRATFSTGAGSSPYRNQMTIGPNYGDNTNRGIYRSITVPSGNGGLHIVVLYRDSLGLYSNDTYLFDPTNYDRIGSAAGKLNEVVNNPNLMLMIASIGNMSFNADDNSWMTFGTALEKLGGTYDVLRQLGGADDYSLVGWSGATIATGAIEASSVIQRAINGPKVPANIRGVLKQDVLGNYGPAYFNLTSGFTQSTFAMLDAVALQTPTPFPPFNVGQLNAYTDLSQSISTTSDVRSLYIDPDQDPNKWLILAKTSTYSQTNRYTQAQFESVRTQLIQEFIGLISIYKFRSNLKIFYNTLTLEQTGILDQVYNDIKNGLQPPQNSEVPPIWQAIFGSAGNVMGAVVGAFQPEAYIAYDIVFTGIQTAMEFAKTTSGSSVNNLNTTFDQLKDQSRANFAASQDTLNRLFDLITTDWGRIQRLGIQLANGKIEFGTDAQEKAVTAMNIALRRQYFIGMNQSVFARAVWNNIGTWGSTVQPGTGDVCAFYQIGGGHDPACFEDVADPSNFVFVLTPKADSNSKFLPYWQLWNIGQPNRVVCDSGKGPANPAIFGPMFAPFTFNDVTKLGIYKPHYIAYQGPAIKYTDYDVNNCYQ